VLVEELVDDLLLLRVALFALTSVLQLLHVADEPENCLVAARTVEAVDELGCHRFRGEVPGEQLVCRLPTGREALFPGPLGVL